MIIDLTARYPVAGVPFRPAYSTPITKLVIHHLEFGNLREGASQAEEMEVLDAVYAFHVNVRYWGGIGYHGISFRSGRSYITADWNRWGAHTYQENDDSRGFAVAGDWSNKVPPLSLRQSVADVVDRHDSLYFLAHLTGHRDFVKTTCPGDPYLQWVPNLRTLIEEDEMEYGEFKDMLIRAMAEVKFDALDSGGDPQGRPYTLGRWLGSYDSHRDDAGKHSAGGDGLKRGDKVTLN
jgi:hypothetical protein